MDLKSLKIFLRVCEMGSLTKAAIALGVTQPTLSRAIGSLEDEFGGSLFYRTGRGVEVTDFGKTVLPLARNLVAHADEMVTDIREQGKSPTGTVVLGVLPSMTQHLAARLFEVVRAQYPGVRLRIYEGFSDKIDEWLASGFIDIGILSRYRATRPQQEEVLLNSGLMLVGPPSEKPVPEQIDFHKLVGLPLVLPVSPNGLRLLVDETANRLDIKLNVILEADSLSTQKDVIQQCGCYSVLSARAVFHERQAGLVSASQIINPVLTRQAILTSTTHRPLSRSSREVLRLMHQVIDELRTQMGWE
ncbi:LysR family transcriptional regulator [Aestuariirhabdus litorea]|uniref:LysR family transcriptional regulator n=1 Tax=Aestuariirhabdus litorea TaxID=2528527 RepID=A0A3P3VJE4_9GAMM|nr:LysR family transcriptional regulator [Aestuariirhabdus litorea]RRJ82802.1 LysR family transcriptional regulator [Aestuariirhabdus litorea]RWW92961.1 LysR family transcriptional regulator [Endozoicomonadaceae bacterium GTF-13]